MGPKVDLYSKIGTESPDLNPLSASKMPTGCRVLVHVVEMMNIVAVPGFWRENQYL